MKRVPRSRAGSVNSAHMENERYPRGKVNRTWAPLPVFVCCMRVQGTKRRHRRWCL